MVWRAACTKWWRHLQVCRGCANPVTGTGRTSVDIGVNANLELVDNNNNNNNNRFTALWNLSGKTRVSRYQKKHSPTTLIVVINHPYQLSPSSTIHGILPIVDKFCYLGDMLSVDRHADAAVETRIRIGWNKFRQLVPLLTNKDISLILLTTTTTTILQLSGFCPGLPGWAGTRK